MDGHDSDVLAEISGNDPAKKKLDEDRDSLHILPLSIIPLETQALKRCRLIKNIRLDSIVEFFNERNAGSGQVEIEALGKQFGWSEKKEHPDLIIMRKLGGLQSYDVFSLRILLRTNGIRVNDHTDLKLSARKNRELTEYMTSFTQPLMQQIYGDDNVDVSNTSDLIGLFRDPDVSKARERLETMAAKLELKVDEVPKFLEDYGDIFMSLSYYRQCLDTITPIMTEFLETMETIRSNFQLRNEPRVMRTCGFVESTINELLSQITGRFETFERRSRAMWDNISAERFREVETLIKSYHTNIGGILCGLSVKMKVWQQLFPNTETASPQKLADFIMSDMKQGLDKINALEFVIESKEAPD